MRHIPRLSFFVFLLSWFFFSSCAARGTRPPSRSLAEATALVTAGCYACLVDALAIYDALLARRPSLAATRGAFRTSVLLALREKEIGLPALPFLERARALATRLPPAEDAPLVLEIAEGLGWDFSGMAPEFTEQFLKRRAAVGPQAAAWRTRLQPRLADPFYAYLDTALACSYGDHRTRDDSLAALSSRHAASRLIKYRVGACTYDRRHLLEEALAGEPRYAEAHLFLGHYALIDASRGRGRRREVAAHLTVAYDAFPRSPSVTIALAGMYRAFNRLKDALRYYDETLAIVPTHRGALLGRIIALSYTNQPEAAIASATRMIELGEWYLGDAYYWRAFNERGLARLDAARDDVERAKGLVGIRSDVSLLAGIIYYDRRELDTAAADLARAWEMNDLACEAPWYLGLVRSEQKRWSDAIDSFPKAAACYGSAAEVFRAELEDFRKNAGEDAADDAAEALAEYARRVEDALLSQARAYYNAGYVSAQGGDRARGIEYAERAARHAAMKAKADELVAALRKNLP